MATDIEDSELPPSNPRGPRRGVSLLLLYRRKELAAQIKGLPRHHHGRFRGIGQSSSAQARRERPLRLAGREDAIQARRGRAGDQRGQQN